MSRGEVCSHNRSTFTTCRPDRAKLSGRHVVSCSLVIFRPYQCVTQEVRRGPGGPLRLAAWAYFISKRRPADHAPGVPAASTARTLHHILLTGSVLIVYAEAVTAWFTMGVVVKLDESETWIVY